MAQPIPAHDSLSPARPSAVAFAIVAATAVLAVVLIVGAATLWMHYGTAVFFEMIKSGIAACI